MKKYIGSVEKLTHYETIPSPAMPMAGWINLINRLGGVQQVDLSQDGDIIDVTVQIPDPRDGSPLTTQKWMLISEDALYDQEEGK